jgi:creatinine amidohydrolase
MRLGDATWPDIDAQRGRCLLMLPLGSIEQHGPHLPLDTDARIAGALASHLASTRRDVVVAPVLPFGASGEHAAFPGTLLIGHAELCQVVVELVRSARASFAGIVVVSAHGGNAEALHAAAAQCAADGEEVLFWTAAPEGGDAHAGRTETSLMLAIDPGAVRLDRAEAGCTAPLASILPRLRAEGVRPVSSSGVLGDPRGASVDEGKALLERMAAGLNEAITARWPDRQAEV